MHLHALVAQRAGEGIVLFVRLLRPHHIVEQQLADVPRDQPGQLKPWPVDDGLAELADLGLHAEGHDCSRGPPACWPVAVAVIAAASWPLPEALWPWPAPWPLPAVPPGTAALYGLPAGYSMGVTGDSPY